MLNGENPGMKEERGGEEEGSEREEIGEEGGGKGEDILPQFHATDAVSLARLHILNAYRYVN